MVKLKSAQEIEVLRRGGRKLAQILESLTRAARPGVSALALDVLARKELAALGARPSFLNYRPPGGKAYFPAALCVSINDTIVHGIPTAEMILEDGDLVSLDLGLEFEGMYTDMAVTVGVGKIDKARERLLATTRAALEAGVTAAYPGQRLGDVGAAIEKVARQAGYGLVRELGGHGVGYRVHEAPEVPNHGRAGTGLKMLPGLVIAIEPMLIESGQDKVIFLPDGFTVKTADGSRSAHFEATVAITPSGPEILTPLFVI